MPELPEVETTVRGLRQHVVGRTISMVWSRYHIGTAHGSRANIKNTYYLAKFKKLVLGQKIMEARRIGKNILIDIDGGYTIIIHLKMTGHLMVSGYDGADPMNRDAFIHFKLAFTDGGELVLSDARKFASIEIAKTSEMAEHERVGRLGPDPFDPQLTPKLFYEKIACRKSNPIKSTLLDQAIIAGIGNIYADESLFAASVHPLSHSDKIPVEKAKEILHGVKKIMEHSLKVGGDSKSDYRNILGERGGFQNFHQAYGRKSLPCLRPKCRGSIERIVVGGRGTHFCGYHQILYA